MKLLPMKLSPVGIELIHSFEKCSLWSYPDPNSPLGTACARAGLPMLAYRKLGRWRQLSGDPWTIGWGHTGPEVVEGLVWSRVQTDRAFDRDIAGFESDVNSLVKVQLNQGQFDALVSFAYNCGSDIDSDTKAEGLGDSTLLRLINTKQFTKAAQEFPKWISRGTAAEPGLRRRREAERKLFLGLV